MISYTDLGHAIFPVRTILRDGETSVVVREDGKVFCGKAPFESRAVTECSPSHPAFRHFMYFWAVVFPKNRLSLGFNQIVSELAAERLEQDQDCPYLFLDKTDEKVIGGDDSGIIGFPVLKVTEFGELMKFNPDDFYMNQAYALASNPRIKVYMVIKDFEGNDFPHGWSSSITTVAGELPVFDEDRRTRDARLIEDMTKPMLEAYPKPEADKVDWQGRESLF